MLALGLLLLAMGLRLWQLNDLPAGFSDAEIETIRLSETARQGTITILIEDADGAGREMLVPTALAAVTSVTGNGLIGFRIISVWVGLITLALVYTLGVRLFGRPAGLAAMALLTVTLWHILLSRSVLVETFLPLLIVVTMLALARAIPVYRVARQEYTTTSAFATMSLGVGIGFYIHPVGFLVALATMVFIVYVLYARRSLERQRLSYIGFSVLVVLILTIPYLVFNLNRPDLYTGGRLIGDYGSLMRSIGAGITAIFGQGDANVVHNLPLRPLFDPVSACLIAVGGLLTLRSIRHLRYMLVVIFFAALAPFALLQSNNPNFIGLTVWLVPLALLFGVGIKGVLSVLPRRGRGVLGIMLLALIAGNFAWVGRDLYTTWVNDPTVQTAYHGDLHQLAQHLDATMGTLPTVICYPQLDQPQQSGSLNATQKLFLMMNRRTLENIRLVDCDNALLFAQGGDREQIIFVEPRGFQTMHPTLQQWVRLGSFLQDSVPDERVVVLTVAPQLANLLGSYTTLNSANYGYETTQTSSEAIYPPVRFGGNVTWLGYMRQPQEVYRAGDTLDIINYWRVESGSVPPDLTFFTHILSDPVTIAANRDMISVDVRYLRPRDVFVQITPVTLATTLSVGQYQVSIGAYQEITLARLPVFDMNQVRQGDRLILYPITITE